MRHLSAQYPFSESYMRDPMEACFSGLPSTQNSVIYVPLSKDEASDPFTDMAISLDDTSLRPEMFIFHECGSVVFWGMTEENEKRHLADFAKFAQRLFPSKEADKEVLQFTMGDYTWVDTDRDVLVLNNTIGSDQGADGKSAQYWLTLEKCVVSQGLMKGALFEVFANRGDAQIDELKTVTNSLANRGQFPFKYSWFQRRRVRMMNGQLLQLRGQLNLHSDMLDEPEYSAESFAELYDQLWEHLAMDKRITLLNQRLDYANDVVSMLDHTSSHAQSLLIEILIVLLITIEVIPILSHWIYEYRLRLAMRNGWDPPPEQKPHSH